MDTSLLRYYVEICETKNITKVANRSFISRQALSKSMKKLEGQLGSTLFYTQHGEFLLTPKGECLYRYARELVSLEDALLQEFGRSPQASSQSIRVGYGQTSYSFWSIDHVSIFNSRQKEIYIIPEIYMPNQLFNALENKQIDLGVITVMRNEDWCKTVLVKKCPLHFLLRRDDALAGKPFLEPKDLQNRELLFFQDNLCFYQQFKEYLTKARIPASCVFGTYSGLTPMVNVIRERHGLFPCNDMIVFPNEFVLKPFHDDPALPAPTQDILASMRYDHPNLHLMAQYIKYLSETISGKEHALPF